MLGPPRPGGCEHYRTGPYRWCTHNAVDGERLCRRHVDQRDFDARERRIQQDARWGLLAEQRQQPARHVDILQRMAVAAVIPDLQRLAQDSQNVHTPAVNRQTKAGEDRLLAVATDGRQVGLRILRVFSARAGVLRDVLYVMNDVNDWYNRTTIRVPGDRLYGRLLEGLWALIDSQPREVKSELITRLWEEMSESVGLCTEGHISRLVNVMVGFDDNFKPPVSLGEVLQTKIAAIAAMTIPTSGKLSQARAFMTDLGLPASEQAPWLEALE